MSNCGPRHQLLLLVICISTTIIWTVRTQINSQIPASCLNLGSNLSHRTLHMKACLTKSTTLKTQKCCCTDRDTREVTKRLKRRSKIISKSQLNLKYLAHWASKVIFTFLASSKVDATKQQWKSGDSVDQQVHGLWEFYTGR